MLQSRGPQRVGHNLVTEQRQEACEIDMIISLVLLTKKPNLPETVSIVQAHHNYSQGWNLTPSTPKLSSFFNFIVCTNSWQEGNYPSSLFCEWFYQITCPLEEEQTTVQSHKTFSGRKVDGTEMEGAERKVQLHQTLHILLPRCAEAVLGIRK